MQNAISEQKIRRNMLSSRLGSHRGRICLNGRIATDEFASVAPLSGQTKLICISIMLSVFTSGLDVRRNSMDKCQWWERITCDITHVVVLAVYAFVKRKCLIYQIIVMWAYARASITKWPGIKYGCQCSGAQYWAPVSIHIGLVNVRSARWSTAARQAKPFTKMALCCKILLMCPNI